MSIHMCVCAHCGQPVTNDANVCPHCGAEHQENARLNKIPETIDELRDFCAMHQMPLEKMRFFIGEDYRDARAFGIYKDEAGNCVVYKNKADGSRAVRYEGPDEKYAVCELYEKLKSETELRRGTRSASAKRAGWGPFVYFGFMVLIFAIYIGVLCHMPKRGYYRYENDIYYCIQNDWYLYSSLLDDWGRAYNIPQELQESYRDYYEGRAYDRDYNVSDFSSSSYYDDYDWDSGDYSSWDSFDTDWSSDW